MSSALVLLPYQTRWVRDRARVKVAEKSRQVGFSWATAAAMTLDASRANGKNTWYVGYNKEMAKEFVVDAAQWAMALSQGCSEIEESIFEDEDNPDSKILIYSIRFASGNRITALSSRPRSLRNKRGHIIIDEAAFHDDFPGLLKSARGNFIWGGDIWIMSTHNGEDSAFNKLLEDCRAGRLNYPTHRVTFDDAIKEGLFERIAKVTGQEYSAEAELLWRQGIIDDCGDDVREELFCIPSRSGGTYLSRPLIESCMYSAPVLRFEAEDDFAQLPDDQRKRVMGDWLSGELEPVLSRLPRELCHAFGEDFGRTADLTVIAPVTLNQNLSRTFPFLVELRNVPFREQEQCLFFVVDRLPRFFYGALDAGGNGQYLAERAWQRYGENRIEQVALTEKWYGENLPPLKADLEEQMTAMPRDADVLSDMQAFQIIDGVPRMPKVRKTQKAIALKKNAKRHGDAGIAIVLGRYASQQEIRQYSYDGVPSGRHTKGLD